MNPQNFFAELKRRNVYAGQIEPAIITCDGFLINGNRRKMVLERLREKHRGTEEFASVKVVILPGPDDTGARRRCWKLSG